MRRRTLLAAGLASAAGLTMPQLAAAAASAGTYGSGALSDWTAKPRRISTASQTRAADVWMFGDSIAVQDGYEIAQRLYAADGSVMVHNWGRRPTAPAVDALAAWASAYELSRVLMATGSNDIFDPPGFRAQFDRVMSIVAGFATVVWVNVHVSRWSQPAAVQVADQRNSGWVNMQLADAQAALPNPADPAVGRVPRREARLPDSGVPVRRGAHVGAVGAGGA